MAEVFVPKIIGQLSAVAFTEVREGVNLLMGVEEEVCNLSSTLTKIQNLPHDAERRRLKAKDVGVWLETLEDITYEMEDVLDEWNIKIHKPKNLAQKPELTGTRMSILLKKIQGQGHHDDDDDDDNAKVTAFPSLKRLSIRGLSNWETWEDISEEDEEKMKNGTISIMPRLEQLEIYRCDELKALPHRFLGKSTSLKSLTIVRCDQLCKR